MAKYKVISGALMGGVNAPHGHIFDGAVLKEAELKELVERGIIEVVGKDLPLSASQPKTPGGAKPPAKPTNQSKWDLDPTKLAANDLDTLNALVAERDVEGKIKPFSSKPEAIAFLSQDFIEK